MPLPLAPLAIYAVTYGSIAYTAFRVAKRVMPGRRDQRAEDTMDGLEEGVTFHRDTDQVNATSRLRRVFRFGDDGPAYELDASALGRVRFRKI